MPTMSLFVIPPFSKGKYFDLLYYTQIPNNIKLRVDDLFI